MCENGTLCASKESILQGQIIIAQLQRLIDLSARQNEVPPFFPPIIDIANPVTNAIYTSEIIGTGAILTSVFISVPSGTNNHVLSLVSKSLPYVSGQTINGIPKRDLFVWTGGGQSLINNCYVKIPAGSFFALTTGSAAATRLFLHPTLRYSEVTSIEELQMQRAL